MSNAVNIKTIVMDLDRTLLHTDKTLSDYTLKVLKQCREHGIQIMVATARPHRNAIEYCKQIGCDAIVASNGARVICGDQQTDSGICLLSAVHLLQVLNRHPSLLVTLETGEIAYSNRPIADYETTIASDLAGIAKIEGALKILVRLDNEETLDIIREGLTEDLYYTVANGYLIQIMDKAATKWNGIKAMLELGNCSPAETAYFGDDNDDIESIKMCGMGVAVSNAIDEVKAVADHIAESNDADGVARFIERVLL